MATWPTGWQQRVLRATGIPVTQFALDVLSAWQASTPVEPWTNNPLGMPSRGSGAPPALQTPYAAFPSMQAFTDSFKRHMKSSKGRSVQEILISTSGHADAWREIHALGWPANSTEGEYPKHLMDKVVAAYTDKIAKRNRPAPKTAGVTHAPPDLHDAMRKQARLLHHASSSINGASAGIAHILKGMNGHGS